MLSSSLVSLVSAQESINIIYPENVIFGEEFEVNLTLIDFPEDIYDVKIDIYNETTPNIARRNWIDGWLLNRWMNNHTNTSITNNKIIKLNVTKIVEGISNMTIKIRKNGDTNLLIEQNYQINISLPDNTTPPDDGNDDDNEPTIDLELEWDEEEIINGEEFYIKLIAENLDETKDYDVKLWIVTDDDDEDEISQTYDENDEWVSWNRYYDEFFSEKITKTKKFHLRIHEDYEDYEGDARIYLRIRESDGAYISELDMDKRIEILEKEEESNRIESLPVQTSVPRNMQTIGITGSVIRLGSAPDSEAEDLKEQENILYQSKIGLIKKYAIYAFAFFCIALSVLLAFHKIK